VVAWDDVDEYVYVGKDRDWEIPITLPSSCGNTFEFAVAAVGEGGARSPYSERYTYIQPECSYHAEVTFVSFVITSHDDDTPVTECDEAELEEFVFKVSSATTQEMRFYEGSGFDTACYVAQAPERYQAPEGYDLGEDNILLVDVEPAKPIINVFAWFWDDDTTGFWNKRDLICGYGKRIDIEDQDLIGYIKEFSEVCQKSIGKEQNRGTIQLNYRLRIYGTPID
jgi:hypothetical protein